MGIFDFNINDLAGNHFDWTRVQGKKILLVNTASACGLTPQYEALEEIHRHFKDQNFTVIGIPSNDFAGQEPGTAEEIAQFCQAKFDVSFPMLEKISVKGENQHPLYAFICAEIAAEIQWNFQKIAIDTHGNVVRSFDPQVLPNDPEIISWIEN